MESGLRRQQERAGSSSGQQEPGKEFMEASAFSGTCALDSVLQGEHKCMHVSYGVQEGRFVQTLLLKGSSLSSLWRSHQFFPLVSLMLSCITV